MHIIFSIICFIVTQQMEHWNEKKYKDQNDSSVTQSQYLTAYHALDFLSQIFNPLHPNINLCIISIQFFIHFLRCWDKSLFSWWSFPLFL